MTDAFEDIKAGRWAAIKFAWQFRKHFHGFGKWGDWRAVFVGICRGDFFSDDFNEWKTKRIPWRGCPFPTSMKDIYRGE